jgi:hypothetical protein
LIMPDGPGFPLIYRGAQRSGQGDDLEVLLEHLPSAAMLVDGRSGRIAAVNLKLTEMTLYTRAELTSLDLSTLFPDWPRVTGQALLPEVAQLEDRSPAPPLMV